MSKTPCSNPRNPQPRMIITIMMIITTLIYPCSYALSKYERSDHNQKKKDQRRLKLPKVPRRRRALTLPWKGTSLISGKIEATDRHSSSLVNLPAELRDMIWDEYLGFGDYVFVLFNEGYLSSIRSGQIQSEGGVTQTFVETKDGIKIPHQQWSKVGVLPLLLTCKVM
jgi:hypothetical protein